MTTTYVLLILVVSITDGAATAGVAYSTLAECEIGKTRFAAAVARNEMVDSYALSCVKVTKKEST